MTSPESTGLSSAGLDNISTTMARHIDAGDIQGAVTVVSRRGETPHFESHGLMDVSNDRPMAKDAIFRMASSTKPILGVAAMMMIESGKMHPSDHVSRYLPEFSNMQVTVLKDRTDRDISPMFVQRDKVPEHRLVPAEREITIHDLLTHTSGLMSGGMGSFAFGMRRRGADETLASYIPTLGEAALDFQPGSRWTYSPGTGHDVVARIIEIVSDTPFDAFLQRRIFDPLDMKDTHFNVPEDKAARRVVIRDFDASAWGNQGPTKYFSASGGLSSTAHDYHNFEQMFLNGGELAGNRLISEDSLKQMASNQIGDLYKGFAQDQVGSGFGYTVSVVLDAEAAKSSRKNGAFGWGGAFGTLSWTDPAAELTAVLMLQQPHGGTQNDFGAAVYQALI